MTDLQLAVSLIAFGGSFGGVLELLRKVKIETRSVSVQGQEVQTLPLLGLGIIEALLGIGGAIALTLVITWANKFPDLSNWKEQLWLFCLYVVAGFAGRRILPMVSEAFEKKLDEALRVAQAAEKGVAEAKQQALEVDVLTRALDSLRDPSKSASEREALILELEAVLEQDGRDRKVVIVLGRLHAESPQVEADEAKRLRAAIAVLTRFLDGHAAAKAEDTAAVLYNRACYRVRLSQIAEPREKELGYQDLERSAELDPSNGSEAAKDTDFGSIRAEERFQRITARSTNEPSRI